MSRVDEKQPLNIQKPMPSSSSMEEPSGCTREGTITFVLGLIFGTFSAVITKTAYEITAVGIDGQEKEFSKPIMMLLLMFVGMVPAGLIWVGQQLRKRPEERESIDRQTLLMLIIPSFCDLLCTALLLIAQLYITASLWQMMRGSIIIITALLKRFILQKRLRRYMWAGVGIITIAMCLVASTSFITAHEGETSKDPRIGVLLVIVGCIAQGVQYVFEERVMAVEGAPPLVVIGMEGLWGTVLSLLVVYPIADAVGFENPWDALYMMQHSTALTWLAILFVITVTGYNCAAVYVTAYLSSIWHAILDNFRPITIWVFGLLLYYVIAPGQGIGEYWSSASWLQLLGLIVLFLGTAVYNGSLGTFGDDYIAIDDMDNAAPPDSIIKAPIDMASPALGRSPLVHRRNTSPTQGRMTKLRSLDV